MYSGPTVGVGVPVGKGNTTITSSHTTLSGSNQTLISRRLAPPEKPKATGPSCLEIGLAIILFFFGGGSVLQALIGILSVMFSGQASAAVVGFFLGLFWLAFGGGLIWAGVAILRRSNEAAKINAAKRADQIPKWEMAIGRWNQLYYCMRDDGVFDPEEKIFVPTEEMMNYLYR